MDKLFKEVSVKKLYKDCILLARFYGQRVSGGGSVWGVQGPLMDGAYIESNKCSSGREALPCCVCARLDACLHARARHARLPLLPRTERQQRPGVRKHGAPAVQGQHGGGG